jgi:hypothetical protein
MPPLALALVLAAAPAPDEPSGVATALAWVGAAGMTAAGVVPLASPAFTFDLLQLPQDQRSAAAATAARLLGVRTIALGAVAAAARTSRSWLFRMSVLNVAVSAADIAVALLGAVGQPDLLHPALVASALAGVGLVFWGVVSLLTWLGAAP